MDHETPFPLRPRDEDYPHASLRRQVTFHPLHMRELPRERHARAHVHAELHHLVAVVFQPFAKIVRGLALQLRPRRQIEGYDQPAHFEFFGVHGGKAEVVRCGVIGKDAWGW